jgi:alpha-1,3-glucan synthase
MRAWSAKQRFPVAQWLEGLTELQDEAVRMHGKHQKPLLGSRPNSFQGASIEMPTPPSQSHSRTPSALISVTAPGSSASSIHETDIEARGGYLSPHFRDSAIDSSRSSVVNLGEIVGGRKDFALQQVDPFFTDADEEFYKIFAEKLNSLNGRNSTTTLCTEEYIVEATRIWFSRRHDAKVGVHSLFSSRNSSAVFLPKKKSTAQIQETEPSDGSEDGSSTHGEYHAVVTNEKDGYGFDFGENYVPPTGLRK